MQQRDPPTTRSDGYSKLTYRFSSLLRAAGIL